MNVRIEKIAIASFGKLKMVTVTPSSGINILSAPNESGKSTLAAFIKFVFYGFTGARKSFPENERKLYTPWDSEISEGALAITADGVRYDIYRKCLPSGKETVEIINRSTGKPEFKGEVPGEVFFGVGEEVFARTLFFRQLTVPQSKDDVLAERLRNIAIGADEEVGTEKALHRLNEAKKEIKSRLGGGLIPKMEKERDQLEALITDCTDARREVTRLQTETSNRALKIEAGAERLENLEAERKNIEKYESLLRLQNINRVISEHEIAGKEYESARALLRGREINIGALNAKNTELLLEKRNASVLASDIKSAQAELDGIETGEVTSLSEPKKSGKSWIAAFVMAALGLVAGVVLYFMIGQIPAVACFGVAAIAAVSGALMFAASKKRNDSSKAELNARISAVEQQKKTVKMRIESRKSELMRCEERAKVLNDELFGTLSGVVPVSRGDDYSEEIEKLRALISDVEKKEVVWKSKQNELAAVSENVDFDFLAENAKGATLPERDRATVDRELKFYGQQQDILIEQARHDELACAALEAKLGDVASLVGKRNSLNARINELSVKHKAYETAMRVIEEAADHMKGMIAPRIGKRASDYFSVATGGKYSSFDVDTSLSMSFGEDFRRSCDYLSAGTRDSAYLSLRLALADILFCGCGVPMLLDDAFVRMDEARLKLMAGALGEASKNHQIFIFTHGEREKNAFSEEGIAFNEISIKNER